MFSKREIYNDQPKENKHPAVVLQLVLMDIVVLEPPDTQAYVPAARVAFCCSVTLRMMTRI